MSGNQTILVIVRVFCHSFITIFFCNHLAPTCGHWQYSWRVAENQNQLSIPFWQMTGRYYCIESDSINNPLNHLVVLWYFHSSSHFIYSSIRIELIEVWCHPSTMQSTHARALSRSHSLSVSLLSFSLSDSPTLPPVSASPEAARSSSSSPVLSSSPNNIVLIIVDYCWLLFSQTILFFKNNVLQTKQ